MALEKKRLADWRKQLTKAQKEYMKELSKEVRKLANKRVKSEKSKDVPVQTGALRRSIKVSVKQVRSNAKSGASLRVQFKSALPYAFRAKKFFDEITVEVAEDLRASDVLDIVAKKTGI